MLGIIGKNIRHRPWRNGALILAFAFIAASLFSGQYLLHGASESIEIGVARMGADMVVVPERYRMDAMDIILRGEPSTFFFADSNINRVASVEGVEGRPQSVHRLPLGGLLRRPGPVRRD